MSPEPIARFQLTGVQGIRASLHGGNLRLVLATVASKRSKAAGPVDLRVHRTNSGSTLAQQPAHHCREESANFRRKTE
jgi:hypothetical protein